MGGCCFYEGHEVPTFATPRCEGEAIGTRSLHDLDVPACDAHKAGGGFVRLLGLEQTIGLQA